MTAIDRTAYPRPGARLTREELGVRYDLTEAEVDFVRANARADTGRLLLAVLLKTRRDFGCFPAPRDIHAGIVAHVGAQLELITPHAPTDELRRHEHALSLPCRDPGAFARRVVRRCGRTAAEPRLSSWLPKP